MLKVARPAPWIQDYMSASAETIKAATTDAYTDNYRERRQYAQTGYYASLGNYFLFGCNDDKLRVYEWLNAK